MMHQSHNHMATQHWNIERLEHVLVCTWLQDTTLHCIPLHYTTHCYTYWHASAHLLNIVQAIRNPISKQAIAIEAVCVHSQVQVIDQLRGGSQAARGGVMPDQGDLQGAPAGAHTELVALPCCSHGHPVHHLQMKWLLIAGTNNVAHTTR